MDAYLGSIWAFGFGWAPRGYALCNGQLLPISQNDALFALLGTIYGGDGVTTFALPNLQGRAPIGTGQGPALPNYVAGQVGGSENVTLLAANLPAHNHPVLSVSWPVNNREGETADPTNNYYGVPTNEVGNVYNAAANAIMHGPITASTGMTGSNIPISILSPFLTINYCIATEGLFPQRN